MANGIGGVEFTTDSVVSSQVSLLPRVPDTDEVMSGIKTLPSLEVENITSYPEGVLVHLEGDRVNLYTVQRREVGRVYDLGVLVTLYGGNVDAQRQVTNLYGILYGGASGGYRAGLEEARWDDPDFPEEPLPTALRNDALAQLQALDPGATLAEIPTEGDYFDQYRIEKGTLIKSWTLTRDNWKVLLLESESLSSTDGRGFSVCPPVFIRGKLRGKLLLGYEGPEIDLHRNRGECDIVVLGDESEDGINGGVLLEDSNVITDPNSTDSGSPDQLMLISRGVVRPMALPRFFLGWVSPPSDRENRLDILAQSLPDWTAEDLRWVGHDAPHPPVDFYGITCAQTVDLTIANYGSDFRAFRISPSGITQDRAPHKLSVSRLAWSDLDGPRAPILLGANEPFLPRSFRWAFRPRNEAWRTYGSHSSMEVIGNSSLRGVFHYDYRWRSLDAELLREQLGLPVGPMLIDRQGL